MAAPPDDQQRQHLAANYAGIALPEAPVTPQPEPAPQLSIIRVYRDLPEALLAKSLLDSGGFQSFLFDDNIVRLNWFLSNAVGDVKLCVMQQHVDDADLFLRRPRPERFDVGGVGEYVQPRCPACQSFDVSFRELIRPVVYACLYAALPVPLERSAWKCHSCRVEWSSPEDAKQLPLNWTLIRALWVFGLALVLDSCISGFGALSAWFWLAYLSISAVCIARYAAEHKLTHAFLVGFVVDGSRFLAAGLCWMRLSGEGASGILIFTISVLAPFAGAFGGVILMGLTWLAALFVPGRKNSQHNLAEPGPLPAK